jgi:opacity protein-like surface antigen
MKRILMAFAALALAGALAVAQAADSQQPTASKKADAALSTEQADQIKKLLAQLSDDNWQTRYNATEALKKIGKPALPLLQEALAAARDEEAKLRIRAVIKSINEPPPEPFDPMKNFGATAAALGAQSEPNNPLGALGGLGELISGMLGAASGGNNPGDVGGLLSGLLGNLGGDGDGRGGLLGMLGGLAGANPQAALNSGPRLVLMPPTTVMEKDKKFRLSHKVVIVVEITDTKDGVESKRIVIADDEDDLQKKDPEAYRVYIKNIRPQ